MSRVRTTMNRCIEILRLKHDCGLSVRRIAEAVGASPTTVQRVLRGAGEAAIGWPVEEERRLRALEERLFPLASASGCASQVDYGRVHEELRRKGVTLKLLWSEQRSGGYRCGYSQFCDDYGRWRKARKLTMRKHYQPGDYAFVDYSGMTVPVGGRKAEIFVAALAASRCTHACAVWSQNLGDWLRCLTLMLEYFGGCPAIIVSDNLRSAVTRSCRYDPDMNGAYRQWADHYGVCVAAARVRKPRDKAIAENAVLQVQRRILAPHRDHRFSSLSELNRVIRDRLAELNAAPFSNRPGSRIEAFRQLDQPELAPLPGQRFELTDIKAAKVGFDCHVQFERHWYSVPHEYCGRQIEINATPELVRIFFNRRQIALHPRAARPDVGQTTELSHLPEAQRQASRWTPEKLRCWAADIGGQCELWVEARLGQAQHFHQVSRLCLGVLSLSSRYGRARLNLACRIANRHGLKRHKQIEALLKEGRDLNAEERQPAMSLTLPQDHENLRGAQDFK